MNVNYIIDLTCQICGCVQSNQNAILNHYYTKHFQKQCENDLNEFFGHFSLKFSRYCSKCNYDNGTNADIVKAFCHVCYHKLPEYIYDWNKNQSSSNCKKSLKKDKSSDHKTQAKITNESKLSNAKVQEITIKTGALLKALGWETAKVVSRKIHKCQYCTKEFITIAFLENHMKKCHKKDIIEEIANLAEKVENEPKPVTEKPVVREEPSGNPQCSYCGSTKYTHHGIKPHSRTCKRKHKGVVKFPSKTEEQNENATKPQPKTKEVIEKKRGEKLDRRSNIQKQPTLMGDDVQIEEKSKNDKKRKLDEQPEDVIEMAQPLVTTLLNKHFPTEGKISCLSAISSLITKDTKVCEFLAKKDIIEEIANLAEKVENEPKHLIVIAKIFSKLNGLKQGKELIDEVRMPIKAYKKLQDQMRMCEISENSESFSFSSEESTSKKIKREIMKTEQE